MRAEPVTPVAVIGMACRLPGGIDSPQRLWDALLRGDDLVGETGAVLDLGFDCDFFGMTEGEAAAVDPQHRLLLESSWDAIEHAGLDPSSLAHTQTGVFVGLTRGNSPGLASGRVAHALGLHGPAFTVDTACSSGLMAVHQACGSLQSGESDLALAGGVVVSSDSRSSDTGSPHAVLSPTGRCRAFDVAADGFVSGEGCVVLLLKRLADAERDGDRVVGVLRGTAANQDGRTADIATPSATAQIAVYQSALAAAGVDAATIGFVEAHGTGTPAGDPIEYASLAAVYGTDGPCALGSVKTNFGHLQSTSGVLGLMKAILALQHGSVPRNLHFTRLPDHLAEIETELFVPQATASWPTNGHHPRRAAVSSYGLSGTNVHAILEQAPQPARAPATVPQAVGPLPFPVSATSVGQLRVTAARLADWVAEGGMDGAGLRDLGYTLSRRRAQRPVRTVVWASDLAELVEGLRDLADSDLPHEPAVGDGDRGPVWVFSGHGSPRPAMGAELLATEPVFAATVAAIEPVVAAESGFSVTEAVSGTDRMTAVDRAEPTIFAIQVALAETMKSHGVRPGAVIGHALGEAAAAVVAGALSLTDGARVVCRASRLLRRVSGGGAVASVELPGQQVLSELSIRGISDVELSVVASPTSTLVGGDAGAVRDLIAAWQERGVVAREVAVDVASHSPQVDPILDDLVDGLAGLQPAEPEVPYYSATLWNPKERPSFDADYWAENLRYTVRFAAAVQAALKDGFRVFGELSSPPLLTDAIELNAAALDLPVAALAAHAGVREFIAATHCAGAAVDFSVAYPAGRLVDAPLPTWTHRELLPNPERRDRTYGAAVQAVHPLLGAHVHLREEPERHLWQGDHRIHGATVLSGAAYCEMALAAARATLGEASEVCDVTFGQTLVLADDTQFLCTATMSGPGVLEFTVDTIDPEDPDEPDDPDEEDEYVRRASAVLRAVDAADVGNALTALSAASVADGEAMTLLAEVTAPGAIRAQQSSYGTHPTLLDACFQSVIAHPEGQQAGAAGLLVPAGVRRLRIHQPTGGARYCLTRITSSGPGRCEADIDVVDETGLVLLTVEGLVLAAGSTAQELTARMFDERAFAIEWQPRDLPEAPTDQSGSWLLLAAAVSPSDPLITDLQTALRTEPQGGAARCATATLPARPLDSGDLTRLRSLLAGPGLSGVVVVAPPDTAGPEWSAALRRGRDHVSHLVAVARELSKLDGEPPRLFVVTRNAASVVAGDVTNLELAGLRGLTRVIDAEHPHLGATGIDVDAATDAGRIAQQLRSGSDEDETAWRDGLWYAARLRPAALRPADRRTTVVDHARDGMRLQISTPGDLETLEFVAAERVPPGPGEIEVAVAASSVNFADVLVASGRYPTAERRPPHLGGDFAGVVTAVGPGVPGHRVGDRVGGMSRRGCWGTFVLADARLAITLPPQMPPEVAAAVPTAAAAWYGLHDLARITAGDRVLIHSGTGGVGQAAIAIARSVGCEIFATAGSPQRRQLLCDMGIEHVYDSRSTDFADEIRGDTDGYGVDVVLNSLPGAAQRAGIELLASGGRFVELGRRDIYRDTRLGLFPFRRNLSLFAVDLALLADSHPQTVGRLLAAVYERTAAGDLPLPPTTRYPVCDAAAAIRLVGGAQHTGKVVLDMPRDCSTVAVVPPEQVHPFRVDGAYIITGGITGGITDGTGDLGPILAGEMAARGGDTGCGRIVLSSASEPTAQARDAVERLRNAGADIVLHRGDIADPATARELVACATETGLPVRGVLHAAAVAQSSVDATLTQLGDELIDRCWAPVVYGAWNLHEATAGQPLDWFCAFSSSAALVGSPGQGAYAAATSWLDGFARWRRARGLPATAIAWGAWAEVGRATARGDGAAITAAEGYRAFQTLLRYDRPNCGYAPIVGTPGLSALAQRSRFAEAYRSAGRPDRGRFLAELAPLPREEWPSAVCQLVSEQISLLLRRTIDPDRPLSDYGLDSLSNLELRTRIEAETGVRASPAAMITARRLADHLCDQLDQGSGQVGSPSRAASAR